MAKKLVLKTPEISEGSIDLFLLVLGVAVIGFVIYGVIKNEPGRVIEASDRFGNHNKPAENAEPKPSN
jgi:hypothetical protein